MSAYARKWKLSGPGLMRAARSLSPADGTAMLQTVLQGIDGSTCMDILEGRAKLMDGGDGQVVLVSTENPFFRSEV